MALNKRQKEEAWQVVTKRLSQGEDPEKLRMILTMNYQDKTGVDEILNTIKDVAPKDSPTYQKLSAMYDESGDTVNIGGRDFEVNTLADQKVVSDIESKEKEQAMKIKSNISKMTDKVATLEEVIADTEGLKAAVGPNILGRTPTPFSGKRQDFVGTIDQVISSDTLQSLIDAKAEGATFGALSDKELDLLASSASKIGRWAVRDGDDKIVSYDASEEAFNKELLKLKGHAEAFLADQKAQATPQEPKVSEEVEQPVEKSQDQQAYEWMQANPDDPRAAQVQAKLDAAGFKPEGTKKTISDAPSREQFETEDEYFIALGKFAEEGGVLGASTLDQTGQKMPSTSFGKELGSGLIEDKVIKDPNVLQKIVKAGGKFLGTEKLGQGLNVVEFLNSKDGKKLQKLAEEGNEEAIDALNGILEKAPSAKEVIGSAALSALTPLTATVGGATTAAGKIGLGAATGAAFGAAGELEQDESQSAFFSTDTAKEVAKGGVQGAVVGGAVAGAMIGVQKLAEGGHRIAERIYNSAIKPDNEDLRKAIRFKGKTLGREALDRGMKGTDKQMLKKSMANMDVAETKLQKILDKSDDNINKDELRPFFSALKEKWKKTPTATSQKAIEKIDDTIEFLPDTFSLADANRMKRNIYSELSDTAFKLDATLGKDKEINKAMASGLRQVIENKTTGKQVAKLNQDIAVNLKVQDGIIDAFARREKNNLMGVGTMGSLAGKAVGLLTGGTFGKTYSAATIDKAARIIENTIPKAQQNQLTEAAVQRILDTVESSLQNQ